MQCSHLPPRALICLVPLFLLACSSSVALPYARADIPDGSAAMRTCNIYFSIPRLPSKGGGQGSEETCGKMPQSYDVQPDAEFIISQQLLDEAQAGIQALEELGLE